MNNVIFMTERHCFQNLSEVVTKKIKIIIVRWTFSLFWDAWQAGCVWLVIKWFDSMQALLWSLCVVLEQDIHLLVTTVSLIMEEYSKEKLAIDQAWKLKDKSVEFSPCYSFTVNKTCMNTVYYFKTQICTIHAVK